VPTDSLRADRGRLHETFDRLASIGRNANGGLDREAYGETHQEAVRHVRSLLDEAGMETRVDAIGNLIGRAGEGPGAVATGSHLDSVADGGAFDGAVGVVGAAEAARRIIESGVALRRPLEVIAFADEEGRFRATLGSSVMAGLVDVEELTAMTDLGGASLPRVLAAAGSDPDRLGDVRRHQDDIAAFIELHVEQGPIMEHAGVPIGIVTAIAATYRLSVRIRGRVDHAGTAPMDQRMDALLAAARVVEATREIVTRTGRPTARGTVGYMVVRPNTTSAVPGLVEFVVDLRDVEAGPREELAAAVRLAVEDACRVEGLDHSISEATRAMPARTSASIRAAIAEAADRQKLATMDLVSGASHDSLSMAALAPIGMIFVPSLAGRSHTPDETSTHEDIAWGTDVLIETLVDLLTREPTQMPE
jgi:hydantoinase/carbamoylase family amidase